MTDKLRLLVRMDVDGAQVRIAARAHVTSQSLHALYVVVKRANTLMHGPALEVDVTGARVDTAALEELRLCSKAYHLPPRIDPQQSDINIHIRSSASALASSRLPDSWPGSEAVRGLPRGMSAADTPDPGPHGRGTGGLADRSGPWAMRS